jgi:poly-gamma-glutamate capsule biosynthesis protein CapA/YwtB (metallophosphatase superfamily)
LRNVPGFCSLPLGGIDFVSLANNHALDFEEEALFETLDRLDRAGIARAGAGRDAAEAARPAFRQAKGIAVGMIAITDNEPVWKAGEVSAGVNYLPITTDPENLARLEAMIDVARTKADLVVLTAHWGPNMVEEPPPVFREFARAAIDLGVDIFHGHSAHIFQGIEIYKEKVIMYDTGDFVDDYAVDPILRNDISFLFQVSAGPEGISRITLLPTQVTNYQVNQAVGVATNFAFSRMTSLCGRMGTEVEWRDDRLVVPVRPAAAGQTA